MSVTFVDEVERYSLAIHAGIYASQARTIWLKLKPLAHGVEPDVNLIFGLPNQNGFGGIIDVRNIWQASMTIHLDVHSFADVYAVLRSEKPIYFRYTATQLWADPALVNKTVDIEGIQIDTGLEPIGEGVETTPLRTLNIRNGIKTLQKRLKNN